MECPSCRADVSELAKFCSQCGSALMLSCGSCGNSEALGSNFCGKCGATLVGDVFRSPELAPIHPRAAPAERSHITVMFCDLVGSTALSVNLDVEDFGEVISTYHKRVAEIVPGFGGFVSRRVGDGVLIYFGYPNAHEDDPEQAVRASLALIEGIGRLGRPEPLQIRVGIATGLVVVGDLIGSGNETEVLGEVPNLAARLLALAEPNTGVIADSTRKQIGSVFALEDLGFKNLKGFTEPQRAWRVLGENRFKSRFEALRSAETPLVGRQEETELLLRRWAQTRAGEGRVILFSGEAGIGKSRLTVAIRDLIGAEQYTELHYFCSPHHQDSALFPIINMLERAAGFGREDTPAIRLDKLEALMAETSAPEQDVALVADLLLLPTARYEAVEPNPRRRREETFEVLNRQLTALARKKPVLMIFEDLHWIDPTTRDLLDIFIRRIERMPVLLIATFRPDFAPLWADQPHVTVLTLNRLNRFDSEALVRLLALKTKSLPNDLIGEIVERGDGVPLFLEEVTKTVVDASPPRRGSSTTRPSLSVPSTLHASLMARLDRIGPAAKEIAQIGATIGREFSYELAAKVAERSEVEITETLGRLVEAGLIFQRGELPQSSFMFKHGLLQDAAYSTLLRDRRRSLHARIAQAIEEMFPEIVEKQPEVVARHRTEAGLGQEAAVYWQRAGELALRRSAGSEALKHFSNALRLLEEMPDSAERWQQELDIRLGLGTALVSARGFRSAGHEIVDHYARAVTLGRGLGDDKKLFRAMWGNWYTSLITGHTEQALGMANELVEVAERLVDRDLMLEAYHSRWANSHVLGLNAITLADTERGIALYDPERHHAHAYDYGGHDTGVCAYAHSAITLWVTGFANQAIQMSAAALELGNRLGHPPSLAHAAWWSAALRQMLRAAEPCREYAELTIRIGREQGSNIFVVCPLLLGWTTFQSGQITEGLERMEDAVEATRQSVRRFYYDYELLVFAEALLKAGEVDRAEQVVQEAIEVITTSRNRLFEAEAHRLLGACLATRGGEAVPEAARRLLQAIETADRQGALAFKLRAATNYARLWQTRERRREGRELLRQTYCQFTEGLDTPDLREAKALLDEMDVNGAAPAGSMSRVRRGA
ncbi:AAA family ATPase [Bradyrhizobium sp. 44]|uniref:adenylate/guanylate cyclase domain-containing protein n=1 Tax=unclassified Bradyrhizobium TaxID=2631580 RepID=UPI0009DD5257|nr:adenylate/guanylate cyclase domain-containing protein [Bradyrhizobium sp. 44]MCK1284272.1 AAA family ATPase [Bradyrhizobium sp. 44]